MRNQHGLTGVLGQLQGGILLFPGGMSKGGDVPPLSRSLNILSVSLSSS